MLLLFVALLTQDAPKFSVTNPQETLHFLVKLHEPVRAAGNPVAIRQAREKFLQATKKYAGLEIKWKVEVRTVGERDVFFRPTGEEDNRLLVDPVHITSRNKGAVAKLHDGQLVQVVGRIVQIKVSEKSPHFRVELKDATFVPIKP